jgi:hypothetical protein
VICANLRLDQKPVPIVLPDGRRADSGLRKLGALMGDGAEAGCNSVLQPGSILGRRAVVVSMPSPVTCRRTRSPPALRIQEDTQAGVRGDTRMVKGEEWKVEHVTTASKQAGWIEAASKTFMRHDLSSPAFTSC